MSYTQWDQATNVWSQKANFGGGYRTAAVGFSMGTKGYIGTGRDQNLNIYNDFWEYNPANDAWIQLASMASYRIYGAGFSIGTKGYIGTGSISALANKDFWQYYPCSGNPVGTTEITSNESQITLFPNPSNGKFTLVSKIAKREISIYNVSGEKVFTSAINHQTSAIDISSQPNGIYFLHIKTNEGTANKKLIINH